MTEVSTNPGRILNALAPRRAGLSAADSDTLATFIDAHGVAFDCDDLAALEVWGVFDANASQAATFRILFFDEADRLISQTEVLDLEATATENENSEYLSEVVRVVLTGQPKYRIKLISISGDEVDLYSAGVQ